jgi:hypothetical protein
MNAAIRWRRYTDGCRYADSAPIAVTRLLQLRGHTLAPLYGGAAIHWRRHTMAPLYRWLPLYLWRRYYSGAAIQVAPL